MPTWLMAYYVKPTTNLHRGGLHENLSLDPDCLASHTIPSTDPRCSADVGRRRSKKLQRRFPLSRSGSEQAINGIYQVAISEVPGESSETEYALDPGGGRAFAVTAVLDLGLRMLESRRGRQALENLGRETIRSWLTHPKQNGKNGEQGGLKGEQKGEKNGRNKDGAKDGDMSAAVQTFLQSVRCRFPTVRLDRHSGFREDHCSSNGFDARVDELRTSEKKSCDFDPKSAAVLHLDWQLVDKLYWTRLKADSSRSNGGQHDGGDKIVRFRRLQFHLAATVAHHLCHLFTGGFLKQYAADLDVLVDDQIVVEVAKKMDAGAEWEVDFFGGRPRMFIDYDSSGEGEVEDRYVGQSYIVRRGEDGGVRKKKRRMAAVIPQERIDSYLRGDSSEPLLGTRELAAFDLYRDVKKRYRFPKREGQGSDETGVDVDVGIAKSAPDTPLSVPWDIRGEEYELLKAACYDPSVRLVDVHGY